MGNFNTIYWYGLRFILEIFDISDVFDIILRPTYGMGSQIMELLADGERWMKPFYDEVSNL